MKEITFHSVPFSRENLELCRLDTKYYEGLRGTHSPAYRRIKSIEQSVRVFAGASGSGKTTYGRNCVAITDSPAYSMGTELKRRAILEGLVHPYDLPSYYGFDRSKPMHPKTRHVLREFAREVKSKEGPHAFMPKPRDAVFATPYVFMDVRFVEELEWILEKYASTWPIHVHWLQSDNEIVGDGYSTPLTEESAKALVERYNEKAV